MKNKIKKSIGVILLLLIILLSSCNKESSEHTHDYKLKNDKKLHYQECSCGEKNDSESHNLDWTVDTEPTYSAPGYKHKECTVCGYITDENTVIERLLHEEVITSRIIDNDSSMYTQKSFNNQNELLNFCKDNSEKINSAFLCINASSNIDEGIYVVLEDYSVSYIFSYDDEWYNIFQDNYEPDIYNNPLITVSFDIYSEELGSCITDDGLYISISFFMRFGRIDNESSTPTFEFFKFNDGKSAMDNLIRVYDGNECVGEIFYYTELDINREWIVNYLKCNMETIP